MATKMVTNLALNINRKNALIIIGDQDKTAEMGHNAHKISEQINFTETMKGETNLRVCSQMAAP